MGNRSLFGNLHRLFVFYFGDVFLAPTGLVQVLLLDYYRITDDGTNPLTIAPYGFSSVFMPTNNTAQDVHLDVIADYNSTAATGYPFCQYSVVTWSENYGMTAPVKAAFGDLNVPGIIGDPVTITSSGFQPDVAAVKSTATGHCTAWITYVDPSSYNDLWVSKYDFTTRTAVSTLHVDAGGSSNNILRPRIDAYDDVNNLHSNQVKKFFIVKVEF